MSRDPHPAAPGLAVGIDEAMIECLVQTFYARVRADAVLGPIFNAAIADWDSHLAKALRLLVVGDLDDRPLQGHPHAGACRTTRNHGCPLRSLAGAVHEHRRRCLPGRGCSVICRPRAPHCTITRTRCRTPSRPTALSWRAVGPGSACGDMLMTPADEDRAGLAVARSRRRPASCMNWTPLIRASRVDPVAAQDVARWRKAERERLIAARLALGIGEREANAKHIAQSLDQIVSNCAAPVVSIYWPFRGEPDLRSWMAILHARGICVALPVVLAKGQPLQFREWEPSAPLARGDLGNTVSRRRRHRRSQRWSSLPWSGSIRQVSGSDTAADSSIEPWRVSIRSR